MHNKRGPQPSVHKILEIHSSDLFRNLLITPQFNCIKLLLNIKDPNLEFFAFKTETINAVVTAVVCCNLKLPACPYCHSANIWRNDYALVKVKYLSSDTSQPLMLKLAKQRIICCDCGQSTMAQTRQYCLMANPLIPSNEFLSNTVVLFMTMVPGYPSIWLSMNSAVVERKLHFIVLDASTHQIIKILPTCYKHTIMTYFKHCPELIHRHVKTVSMDLNYYYAAMVRELFLNAQVILDHFHITQMLNRSFNACRVQMMK